MGRQPRAQRETGPLGGQTRKYDMPVSVNFNVATCDVPRDANLELTSSHGKLRIGASHSPELRGSS